MKKPTLFKAISLVLVVTFVSLDISWAYYPASSAQDSTLATPSTLQQNPPTSYSAELKESIFEDGSVLGSACFIARILLENNVKINKLRWVIEEELGDCARYIDIKRIRVAKIIRDNELKQVRRDEDIPHDAVIFIPYDKKDRKGFIEIALNPNPYIGRFAGRKRLINDKYIAKDIPEVYEEDPMDLPVNLDPADGSTPKVSIEESKVLVPATKAEKSLGIDGKVFFVKHLVLSAFAVLLLPQIVLGDTIAQADYSHDHALGRAMLILCTAIMFIFDRMAVRAQVRAIERQDRFVSLMRGGDAKAIRNIRDDLESPDRNIRRDAIYLLLKMKNSDAAYKFLEASNQDWYPIDELGQQFTDTLFECIENKINFDLEYTPATSNITIAKLGNGKNNVYGKREISIESPSKIEIILKDGSRIGKSGSITLRSLEPISAMAGIAAIAWTFSALKDLIFTYPQVSAAVAISAIIAFAFTWKKILPLSWYMWLMNNYESRGAKKALVAKGAKAVPYLIGLLSSDKFWMRSAAIEVLEEIKDPSFKHVIEPICKYFNDVKGNGGGTASLSAEQSKLIMDAIRSNKKITVEYTPSVTRKIISGSNGGYGTTRLVTLKPASLNISESKRKVPIEFMPEPETAGAVLNREKFPVFEEETPLEQSEGYLKQLEANEGIAYLSVRAMRAKRENQKLIIGLETYWIPGMSVRGSLQRQAISVILKEMYNTVKLLRAMGLDNVEIVQGSGEDLASSLTKAAEKSGTNMRNVIVMASKATIYSDSFIGFRSAPEENRPFLSAIDAEELINMYNKFGEMVDKQLKIEIAKFFYTAMNIAVTHKQPDLSWVTYDEKNGVWVFKADARVIDYENLVNEYKAEATFLKNA